MGQFSMQIWGANGSVMDTKKTYFRLKRYRYKYRCVILARMVFSLYITIIYIKTILMLLDKNLAAIRNH